MAPVLENSFLVEVSWEICNKVGGIYTVLRSKLKEAIANFGNNYLVIGPWLGDNRHFIEAIDTPFLKELNERLKAKNINCHMGYWDTEGKPAAILVDFKGRYKIDVLLYDLWSDFAIDSLASNYEYQEPILFATAAGEVIETIADMDLSRKIIGHFHEWLCGAGLLYLKRRKPNVATVFTTHATVLGRALAGDNELIYNLPKGFNASQEAKRKGVYSKHSLEKAAAAQAASFTTVSGITADEANAILDKYPDKVVYNGLDVEEKQHLASKEVIFENRKKLLAVTSRVIGKQLPENTLLLATSGRYEFHNKGYDVLLKSLAEMKNKLPADAPPIVVFFWVATSWYTEADSLLDGNLKNDPEQKDALGIATHRVYNAAYDNIVRTVRELNLLNDEKIHIIYSNCYLNGHDGVFNVVYEQAIAACDLTVFPSFYEPWGYTPLESIAYATPTITTDLAGFGYWAHGLGNGNQDAVTVLARKNVAESAFITALGESLKDFAVKSRTHGFLDTARVKSLEIAAKADWKYFYQEYLDAYQQAIIFNELNLAKLDAFGLEEKCTTSICEADTSNKLKLRGLQYESQLPEGLKALRDLAYNFWWAWNDEAKKLFQKIDPELWEKVKHNPVYFLNLVSAVALSRAAKDKDFIWAYEKTINRFQSYEKENKEVIKFCGSNVVTPQTPLAYFCMEYGIDECLPIYSGGLGILAGDYLKSMSDLLVPAVAIGLFYKRGYFLQSINAHGEQVALYEKWNASQIPMHQVSDATGKPVLAGVEILGRTVFFKAWEVKVGHVTLYLLDTNVPENNPDDREITDSLYGGTRENRLLQEIILGVGGVRFLTEKMNIHPVLYHLNEGHSAFLLLERVREFYRKGLSFEEAMAAVRYSSIFTTHTPVPAGNEEFSDELIKKYFLPYTLTSKLPMSSLLSLGKENGSTAPVFSMTILALKLTLASNAVSTLHGKVARGMWKGIWPGLLESEVPIGHVTNGVHLGTWLGQNMKLLYSDYLKIDWEKKQDDPMIWAKIKGMPDDELWKAHQAQKEKLIELVKEMVIHQYSLRNEDKRLIRETLDCLNKDVLLLGLSRRFTSYKRNDLILRDKERLAKILNNAKRPIVLLVSGKSHPADGGGIQLIKGIIETLREEAFHGHIIFLEEYNIALAKALVQGIDVWVNTPILGREACGTSGMKVGVNGGLNFSTKDGWWEEAYDKRLGWEIESLTNIEDLERRNDLENMFLLNTLENEIANSYYDQKRGGFSREWVSKMKESIVLTACQYNSNRMLRDYINNFYCSVVLQSENVLKNNNEVLKKLVAWKHSIADGFNTVKIKAVLIDGIKNGKVVSEGRIKVKCLLFTGKLSARELRVEFVLVKGEGMQAAGEGAVIPLKPISARESGLLTYVLDYEVQETGFYSYGIRVYPYNDLLFRHQDAGMFYWG
jgi:glycogen phosphorylase/synthase